MNNLIIKRSQLLEAQIVSTPAVGKKYQFTEIPNLSRNNIIVYGLEAYTTTQLTTTPNNNTPVTAAESLGVVVTLVDNNNNERIYQLPYYSAIRSLNGGFVLMFKPFILNITRSYIQLTNVSTIAAGEVAVFNIYYSIVGED